MFTIYFNKETEVKALEKLQMPPVMDVRNTIN